MSKLTKSTISTLEDIIDGLRKHTTSLIETLEGKPSDPTTARLLAVVGIRLAQILDAVRKAESSEAKSAGHLTKSTVLVWLRKLDEHDRDSFLSMATRIGKDRSILG